MSGSTLQKKVIEFLKKKESNKVKTKDIQEEKIVKEINEYDEVKENISTDIRNSITEYQKLLDFIPVIKKKTKSFLIKRNIHFLFELSKDFVSNLLSLIIFFTMIYIF